MNFLLRIMTCHICLSSVTRVYCDKTAKANGVSLKSSSMPQLSCGNFCDEIQSDPFDRSSQTIGWGGFRFRLRLRDAENRKRFERT